MGAPSWQSRSPHPHTYQGWDLDGRPVEGNDAAVAAIAEADARSAAWREAGCPTSPSGDWAAVLALPKATRVSVASQLVPPVHPCPGCAKTIAAAWAAIAAELLR